MSLLRQAWAAAATPQSNARMVHLFLPDDPYEAHAALVHVSRKTARLLTAADDYDKARIADLVADGGFSHHPVHGKPPSSGFMASYDAPHGTGEARVHHISAITPDDIAEHRDAVSHHLGKPDAYQGGWHDTATGDVYLDASKHFHDEHACREHCADEKQKAYFKLDDFSERFMHPKLDPQAMADPEGWKKKYSDVGTEPHPRYKEFGHLYPPTDEQKQHWGEQGHHLAGWADGKGEHTGHPVGPWLDAQAEAAQVMARRQRGL